MAESISSIPAIRLQTIVWGVQNMALTYKAVRVGTVCAVALWFGASARAAEPGGAAETGGRNGLSWVGTWAAAPQPFIPGSLETYHNQSIRLIIHTSMAGSMVRIKISNLFGDRPLRIGGAHIARRASAADIDSTTDRTLRFAGRLSTTVPPRSVAVSDPVRIAVPALSDLAVSIFLPTATAATTSHFLAQQVSYVSPETGDSTAAVKFPVAKTITSWPFLTGVDVMAPPHASVIVAFGDSTVDGDGITPDSNHRWPDILAVRLQDGGGSAAGVLNEGLIGNRLLHDSPDEVAKQFGAALGQAGIARFARDALGQAGVHCVIVRLGINDIGFPGALTPAATQVTAEQLVVGYRQLISEARKKGIRIVGTTLSPFEGAEVFPRYYTAEKEAVRQEINAWIRRSGEFDAVIDLDAVLRDPGHPSRLLPDYDSGDHLHTNDVGYAAAAKAIPLELLQLGLG
jgi:lysophospholipase L1-like esterase